MSGDGVVAALRGELELMPDVVGKSALAASALALAAEMDDSGTSATAKSMCARALQDHLTQLRELAPPQEEETELDRRRQARAARQRGAATEAASPS